MNERHQILKDRDFWLTLEYRMSGDLRESEDKELRRYWIDGLERESVTNTRDGITVQGFAWVAESSKGQEKYDFSMNVPQSMLHKKIEDFEYDIDVLDDTDQTLEISLRKKNHPSKQGIAHSVGKRSPLS